MTSQNFSKEKEALLKAIQREAELTAGETGRSRFSDAVMDAMAKVPREEFVPRSMRSAAYANNALPIGKGQTISQPFIVALMTELLEPEPEDRILEIGTGSGYQAAVLAEIVDRVYSVEVIPNLARTAREHLQRLGYDNVEVGVRDGRKGWPEHAPYDGILVTAAATDIPQALKEQLAPGGKMVVPIGLPYSFQELKLLEKDEEGRLSEKTVLGVAFVPLTGGD